MAKCFICQENDVAPGLEFECQACHDKRTNPPHEHDFKPFKFSETSNVTYWGCECGERQLTAVDAD